MKSMVIRETSVDEEVIHSIKKETRGRIQPGLRSKRRIKVLLPHMLLPMSNSVGFVNENADHPHAGR